MKSIFKKNNTKLPGFTLLEMLFAVIIFSFALVSLMTIAGKGVIATASARDQLTAQFLAEENLEIARNMRDSNYNDGLPWLTGFENCSESSPCDAEYSDSGAKPVLVPCDGDDCSGRILHNNGGTFDTDGSGDPTSFWRELYLKPLNTLDEEMLMVSTVHWKQKNLNRTMVVKTRIANW